MCTKCESTERYLGKSYCYDCYKEDALEKQKNIRNRNRRFVWRFLKLKGKCVDCGERNWQVLEFDHRDQSTKMNNVSNLYSNHYSIDKIKTEIRKCDIRCANCHKVKTRKQLGWFNFD